MATTDGGYTALLTSVSPGGRKLYGGIYREGGSLGKHSFSRFAASIAALRAVMARTRERQTCVYGGCIVSAKPGLEGVPQTPDDVVVGWHPDAVHHPPPELKERLAGLLIAEALRPEHRSNWQLAMFGRQE